MAVNLQTYAPATSQGNTIEYNGSVFTYIALRLKRDSDGYEEQFLCITPLVFVEGRRALISIDSVGVLRTYTVGTLTDVQRRATKLNVFNRWQ